MSTNCAACGYRDNEIKSGGAISEHGKRITLKVEDSEDLSRDILKSETCGLEIPEIDLVLQPGTLGGRFTTLEGLLTQVYEELGEKVFVHGDAGATKDDKSAFETFLANLKEVRFTMVGRVNGMTDRHLFAGDASQTTVYCDFGRPLGQLVSAEPLCPRSGPWDDN